MITVSLSTFVVGCFVVLAIGAKFGKRENRLEAANQARVAIFQADCKKRLEQADAGDREYEAWLKERGDSEIAK